MQVCYWALLLMPLVILHHLLNVSVQLPNKRGLKKIRNKRCLLLSSRRSHIKTFRRSWVSMKPQIRNDCAVEAQKQITAPLRAESPKLCPPKRSHVSKLTILDGVWETRMSSLCQELNPDSPIVHPRAPSNHPHFAHPILLNLIALMVWGAECTNCESLYYAVYFIIPSIPFP
jgi:hypothetical protein